MSPTEIKDKVHYIQFKESIITHVLTNLKHLADMVTLINIGSMPIIPLPTFTKVMIEYGFTNDNTLTTEER